MLHIGPVHTGVNSKIGVQINDQCNCTHLRTCSALLHGTTTLQHASHGAVGNGRLRCMLLPANLKLGRY